MKTAAKASAARIGRVKMALNSEWGPSLATIWALVVSFPAPHPLRPLVTHPSGGKYLLPAHIENRAERDLSGDVGDEAWAKMAHCRLGRAMNAQKGGILE